MAISGTANASFQAFDVSNEDPAAGVTAQITVVNHEPMPAGPHDEAIVRGWVSTEIEPSNVLVLAQPYQGDETDGPRPIATFAYFGDENETSSPVAVLAYFGDENDSGTPVGKTHGNSALVGQLPWDDHDAEIVMANSGSLRERTVFVAASYQGDESDSEPSRFIPAVVSIINEPLPAGDHDAEIVLGIHTTVSEPTKAIVMALAYQGDETDEPASVIALAYQGDETDDIYPVISLAYLGDESEQSPELQAPMAYRGDETDDIQLVVEFITTEEVESALV